MKRFTSLWVSRREKPIHPFIAAILSIIGCAIGLALKMLSDLIGSEPVLLGLYLVGVTAAAIAWYGNFRWKQALWRIGMMLAGVSIAAMILTAQYWLVAGAFVLLLAVLIYPSIAKQTHDEVRQRREQNRQ